MRTYIPLLFAFYCLCANAEVPIAYQQIASEYAHPPELLFSLALTESGYRYQNTFLPWPWAVNHAGKSIYFDSKNEAYEYCDSLLKNGDDNFDVSVMQVNWHYNGYRFNSLWDAFDPYINIRVGAEILRDYYTEGGSYETAVGYYHSHDANRAEHYRERVREMLSRLHNDTGGIRHAP